MSKVVMTHRGDGYWFQFNGDLWLNVWLMPDVSWSRVEEILGEIVRERPSAASVIAQAHVLWQQLRDVKITSRAERAFRCVPLARLVAIEEKIDDLLYQNGIGDDWGPLDEERSDEDAAYWVAWGLACLRWHYRMMNGRELELNLSRDEVEAWLAQVELLPVSPDPNQPSLFGA